MAECINCCALMKSEEFELKNDILKSARTPTIIALNYIFKVSGKRIEEKISDDIQEGDLGLCHPCWTIVSKLFLLHKELVTLAKLESLVNRTFRIIDSEIKNVSSNKTQTRSNTIVTTTSKSGVSKGLPLQRARVGIEEGATSHAPPVPKDVAPVIASSPVKKTSKAKPVRSNANVTETAAVVVSAATLRQNALGAVTDTSFSDDFDDAPASPPVPDEIILLKPTSPLQKKPVIPSSSSHFKQTRTTPVVNIRHHQVIKNSCTPTEPKPVPEGEFFPVIIAVSGTAVQPIVPCGVTPPPPSLTGKTAKVPSSTTGVQVHPPIAILRPDKSSKATSRPSIIYENSEPSCASELFKIQKRLLASKRSNSPIGDGGPATRDARPPSADGGPPSLAARDSTCPNTRSTDSSVAETHSFEKAKPVTAKASIGVSSSGNRRKQRITLKPDELGASRYQDAQNIYHDVEPNVSQPPPVSVADIPMSEADITKTTWVPRSKPKNVPPDPDRPKRTYRKRDLTKKAPRKRKKPKPVSVTCEQCGRVYRQRTSLKFHMIIAHQKKSRLKCDICEKPMQSQYALEIHLGTHRNPEERAQERARRYQEHRGGFLCQECGKTYSSLVGLLKHEKQHRPDHIRVRKVYACSEPNCNYSALTNKTLRNHKQCVHTDSTYFKFKCERCSQRFRMGSELRNHQGFCCDPIERPHQCVNCGRRCKLKQHLELHYSEFHKMGKESARALVYPGLPPRSLSWNLSSAKRSHKKKRRIEHQEGNNQVQVSASLNETIVSKATENVEDAIYFQL